MAPKKKRTPRRRPSRPKLVSQYLENISRDFVEKHPEIFRQLADGRHGIYALYDDSDLYYVGLAKNLRNRLKSHLKNRHAEEWNRFSMYLTIGDDTIRELEALVLRILKAKGNRQGGQIRRAENLKRRLAREVRRKHRAELAALIGRELRIPNDEEVAANANGRLHTIAARFRKAVTLRATFKKERYRARLRTNGTIRYGGKNFDSATEAAAAACGQRKNGYWFWTVERGPGDWVRLRDLHN